MLCVNTKIAKSSIHGIGLYSDQFIPKGTVVWKFDAKIDLMLTQADLRSLTRFARKQFLNYAFLDKHSKKYILCGDDARFFNHSELCNCDDSLENMTIALRDIEKGEELTVDYRTFYDNYKDFFLQNNIEIHPVSTC